MTNYELELSAKNKTLADETERLRHACSRMRQDCQDAGDALAESEIENEKLRAALKLAAGALAMVSPCAALECKAEQLDWLQAARQAAESALTPNVGAERQ